MKARMLLEEYKRNKIRIKNLEIEIRILNEEDGLKALEYKELSSTGSGIQGGLENLIISNENKIKKIEKQKEILEIKQERILNSIELLNEEEKKIIELRYFSDFSYSWDIIAERLNVSYSAARGIFNRAIKKIDIIIC
ncbi:MAG: sigma factor-like helix-turn-helix DNA-binding protein [Sarcina sp.]